MARAAGDQRRLRTPGPSYPGRSLVASAELIQLGEQIASLHRRRIEDAPGSGGPPPLRRGQPTVKRLPDHGGDRCTALPRESANPLVALIVDENLQPVRQHTHTLACACRTCPWTRLIPAAVRAGRRPAAFQRRLRFSCGMSIAKITRCGGSFGSSPRCRRPYVGGGIGTPWTPALAAGRTAPKHFLQD